MVAIAPSATAHMRGRLRPTRAYRKARACAVERAPRGPHLRHRDRREHRRCVADVVGMQVREGEHVEGPHPILVYRVGDYGDAVERLRAADVTDLRELEIPHGPCASFRMGESQRFAVYELVRPGIDAHFAGRIDP